MTWRAMSARHLPATSSIQFSACFCRIEWVTMTWQAIASSGWPYHAAQRAHRGERDAEGDGCGGGNERSERYVPGEAHLEQQRTRHVGPSRHYSPRYRMPRYSTSEPS